MIRHACSLRVSSGGVSLTGRGGRSGSSGTTHPFAQTAFRTTTAAIGNAIRYMNPPEAIEGRSVAKRSIVATTRPTGPKIVALFSHRDQCGMWPLVGIGEPTKSPWWSGARAANCVMGS
jgi:hypothetical protein